jgi:hypothetical protein
VRWRTTKPPIGRASGRFTPAGPLVRLPLRALSIEILTVGGGQINGTLAWMWLNATPAERQPSEAALTAHTDNLPPTHDAAIPTTFKRKGDAFPEVAVPHGVAGGPGQAGNAGGGPAADAPAVAVPAAAVNTNTTAFAFWPDLNTIDDDIPVVEDSEEVATLEDPTREILSHEIRRREWTRERRRPAWHSPTRSVLAGDGLVCAIWDRAQLGALACGFRRMRKTSSMRYVDGGRETSYIAVVALLTSALA